MNLIRYIIMSLDCFSAVTLLLILICSIFEKNKTTLLKLYMGMTFACTVSLALEALSLMVALNGGQDGNTLRLVLNTVSVFFGYVLAFFYTCYVANLIGIKRRRCARTVKVLAWIGGVAVCFLIVGSVCGWFYTFKNGLLTPAPLFVLLFAFDVIACLAGIVLIILYRKQLKPRDVIGLFSLPSLIFISAALQFASFDMMYALFVMVAVSLFIIYLMIQSDKNRQKEEQEKKMIEMNVAMMLSQIQPHFLYNALSSIRRMIKKDADVAERAVEKFSLYLRKNLDGMSRVEPIPFEKELDHVKEYLYLEKLRFEDRLNVEYDISFTAFTLPVLTLQPIVENAVKHGIMKKEEGGSIKISARREGGSAILTVSDDGVGFLTDEAVKDERVHIGFTNVKKRIEMQCKGTVEVESAIGVGSTVTIKLPLL